MISFLRKYKSIVFGFLISSLLIFLLDTFDAILIDKTEILANVMAFGFLCSLISILIYKAPYIIANKAFVLKVFGLFALFVVILMIDNYMSIEDNPVTIVLIVVLGALSLLMLAPKILFKYKYALLVFYGLVLAYFIYLRVFTDDSSLYFQQQKEIFILLLSPFFIIIYLWTYQQWKGMEQLKNEKGKAELELLKNQVNPHFLFNTLNNLYGLTVEKAEEAPEVVLKLSDMLRYTIYKGKEDRVALKDEVNYLENYISLHKIRYQKQVDIRFDKEIATDLKIAPLLFIILLENAFKHGVESLTNEAYVHIDLKSTKDSLIFQIENNYEQTNKAATSGIGLDNLKKRLQLIYPNQHQLSIEKGKADFLIRLELRKL